MLSLQYQPSTPLKIQRIKIFENKDQYSALNSEYIPEKQNSSPAIKTFRSLRRTNTLGEITGLDRTTIGAFERRDFPDLGIGKVQRIFGVLDKSLSIIDKGLPSLDQLRQDNGDS